jgi:putative addiction module antidote
MPTLKITSIGSATGIVLPPEILERLHVQTGDSLYVSVTPQGIELIPAPTEFTAQMKIAEQIMLEDADALKRLAEYGKPTGNLASSESLSPFTIDYEPILLKQKAHS